MNFQIKFDDRIMGISTKSGIETRYYGELMYFIFNKPYCDLYFTGNKKYCVEISLKDLIENLPSGAFFKCKRSAVVNLCYFKAFRKREREIEMEDGKKIELSKQNVPDFGKIFSNLPCISPPCRACYECDDHACDSQIVFCRRKKNHQNAKR